LPHKILLKHTNRRREVSDTTRGKRYLLALGIGVLLMALVIVIVSSDTPTSISAASGGAPEMGLSLASGGGCGIGTTTCYVPLGGKFEISVDAIGIPMSGYGAAATWVYYGDDLGDQGNQGDIKADSVTWPDCNAALLNKSTDEGGSPTLDTRLFYCATGLILPPPSFHTGSLYTMSLTCTPQESETLIELIPLDEEPAGMSGSVYIDGINPWSAPKVNDLTIRCTDSATDTDGDHCTDLREVGPDETLGGLRDPQNPWDFYDVLGGFYGPPDGVVDNPNDLLGTIIHYSPMGYTPGTPSLIGSTTFDAFDRGQSAGPNAWNMTAPDGVIDLSNDILGSVFQFHHDCT
jgi:hypothetical protein